MPHSQLFIAQHWLFIVLLAFENSSEGLTWSGEKRSEESASFSLMTVLNAWSSLFHDRSYGVHKIYGGRRRGPSCVGSTGPLRRTLYNSSRHTFFESCRPDHCVSSGGPSFFMPALLLFFVFRERMRGRNIWAFLPPNWAHAPFSFLFFPFSFFMAQSSLWQSPKEECVGLAIWLTNEPHKSACHREVLSIRNYPPTIRYVYCDTAFSWILKTSD